VVTVDLKQFKTDFQREHDPVEKAILILCRECHAKYDSGSRRLPFSATDGLGADTIAVRESTADMLPITLEPPQPAEFKRQLLTHRRAEIATYYRDGRIKHRSWDASRFSESSNVMGNLRSRPEFRQGMWQGAGIVKVHVCVTKRDA
jgi:hypothetical protein